jgi:preprotein translocase subunit SecE
MLSPERAGEIMLKKIVDYTKKVKAEMEKVAWPTRKDLVNSTGVVLVLVAIVTVFLGIVDYVLYVVITRILGL